MKRIACILMLAVLMPLFAQGQGIPDDEHDYLITLNTDYGDIKLILYDDTPMHKMNFVKLAEAGVYDHLTFHRIIKNFMIQTGDPDTRNESANYDPSVIEENIPAEIRPSLKNIYGAVGAARRSDSPGKASSGTQFFIIENPEGASHLDNEYTVFGRAVAGFRAIHKIADVPADENDKPRETVRMKVEVDTVKREKIEKFYNYKY